MFLGWMDARWTGPTEDEQQRKRPYPTDLTRHQDDADANLQGLGPCFVKHLWRSVQPFTIRGHKGHRFTVPVCHTGQADRLLVDDARECAPRHHPELI
jgi:hypothetical protein